MITIAGRNIGPGQPCFVIAEAGVNHDGDISKAFALIDAAVSAGADAVKFQTFSTDALVSRQSAQHGMLQALELPSAAFTGLARYCADRNIVFLSTPFDEGSAALLDAVGVSCFKVSSGDLTNLPFLSKLCEYGKPLVISTGMADMAEVEQAVARLTVPFALLHCTSAYPAPPSTANLRAMAALSQRFAVPVGYSDHTLGTTVALAAVALGAAILEKHFTLSRNAAGPDHRASVEPDELRALVREIRVVESALGDGVKTPVPVERATAAIARKSLVAKVPICAQTTILGDAIVVQRPGTGIEPARLSEVIGRVANVDIAQGSPLQWWMLR